MGNRGHPIPGKDGKLVHEYSHDAEPLPEDARVGEWSEAKLKRMDSRFAAALKRELDAKKGTS